MIKLTEGDIVDIIAPASNCSDKEFEQAIKYVESLGLVPRYDIDFRKSKKYLANTDEFRFQDFIRAMKAKDSKLVWCLRGGYGSLRLLSSLKRAKKPSFSKLFIGLSDISVLNQFLIDNWGFKPIHGPVLSRMGAKASSREKTELKRILLSKNHKSSEFKNLKALNEPAQKALDIKAKMIGGNLCSLCTMLGSEFQWNAKSKILFLEEVSERGYSVDRMLTQLVLSGALKGAKAIIFGDFIDGEEPDGKNLVPACLKSFASEQSIPVFKGLKSGHGKQQMPLAFNTKAILKAKAGIASLELFCP